MGVQIVLLGPPGSGKGTLAAQLADAFSLHHISTGDIFRQEIQRTSALGRAVTRYVHAGKLVPDALVVKVMVSRLTPAFVRRGFVFDGFPRTVGQAKGLEHALIVRRAPLAGAVYLECPQRVLISRLAGRLVCSQCGAIYHVRNMPPRRPGRCDRCGKPLITRKDDRADTVKERLRIDRTQSKPLLAYYRRQHLLYRVKADDTSQGALQRAVALAKTQGWVDARRPAGR